MDTTELFLALRVAEDACQEEEDNGQAARVVLGLAVALATHSREAKTARRSARRFSLLRAHLLPNPRIGTPWQHLYASQSDRAFITTMGFDVATFNAILQAGFEESWNNNPIRRGDVNPGGRTRLLGRSLDATGALGLVLHYLSSAVHEIALQQIFAIVPATTSRYIRFGLTILLETLRTMPDARISWPKGDEFTHFNNLIRSRHPLLTGAFASIDGLNLAVQTSGSQDIENATYNGWLHEHFISSIFVFSPEGTHSSAVEFA